MVAALAREAAKVASVADLNRSGAGRARRLAWGLCRFRGRGDAEHPVVAGFSPAVPATDAGPGDGATGGGL
eukprot:8586237-Pyramimonas_sp.AAC.1